MSQENPHDENVIYLETELTHFFCGLRDALERALETGEMDDWFKVMDRIKEYERFEPCYGDNVELRNLIEQAREEEKNHQDYLKSHRAANEAPVMDKALKSTLKDFYLYLAEALKGSLEAYRKMGIIMDDLYARIDDGVDEEGELSPEGFYLERILEKSEKALDRAQDEGILSILDEKEEEESPGVSGILLTTVRVYEETLLKQQKGC